MIENRALVALLAATFAMAGFAVGFAVRDQMAPPYPAVVYTPSWRLPKAKAGDLIMRCRTPNDCMWVQP